MEMFRQAFTIMVLGMALVFVFLAFVIQGVKLSARIIHRIEGAPQEEESEDKAAPPPDAGGRAAAIAVALHRRRRSN
jgi:sodium pump decarboxylase gamma subunit